MEKNITRRDFLKVAGTTTLSAVLAACGSSAASPNNPSAGNATTATGPTALSATGAKGGSITVGMETGSQFWTEFYQKRVADFTSKTGIEFKPLFAPHAEMKQRFITEEVAGSGAIDVYMLDQPWVGQFIAAQYLVPLTSKVDPKDKEDFLPTALATNSSKGEIYGIPFLVHNSVLYYRTDLYQEAGLSQPPKTWDEYRQYAKKLTKADQGVYGAIMEGKEGPEPAAKYMDLLQQAGGKILDDNGNVVLNAGPAVEALKFMLAIQFEDKTSPPGGPGFDNGDTHALLTRKTRPGAKLALHVRSGERPRTIQGDRQICRRPPARACQAGGTGFLVGLGYLRSLQEPGRGLGVCEMGDHLFPIALLLHRGLTGTALFRLIFSSPLMVAPVVGGMLWQFMFADQYGAVNNLLAVVGLRGPLWLADVWGARVAVVIGNLWLATPFNVLILLAGMANVPEELFEAARIDGAHRYQLFRHIMLPLLRPALLIILVIRLTDAFRVFDIVYILTGGGPGSATQTLSVFIYKEIFTRLHFAQGSAASFIMLAITIMLSILVIRVLRPKEELA